MFNVCILAPSKGLSWPQPWSWGPCFSSAAWFSSWGWQSSEVSRWLVASGCCLQHATFLKKIYDVQLHKLVCLHISVLSLSSSTISFTATWHLTLPSFSAPYLSDDKIRPSYLTSLKMLLGHIPYQRLVLGFVFSELAFQVQFDLDAFIGTWHLTMLLHMFEIVNKANFDFFNISVLSQMSLGNFALFCSHAAGLGAQFQHLVLVLLVSCSHTLLM